jgi:hypothetical protein
MIKKQNSDSDNNLTLLQAVISDDTGTFNVIFKNELIKYAKLNNEIIIRNAKVEIINGYLFLICDDNSTIFESKISNIKINMDSLELNYSKIKISKLQYELI